ncbi:MAG: M36 family metallopeptidase [Acidobacteria bacterium]|nr:M36 family metallopeptidase [Acidobacteriota bacterium]
MFAGSPPSTGDPETIARAFLEQHKDLLGIAGTTVFALPLEHRYQSEAAGLTHLVFHQRYAGIAVFGGELLVHITRGGSVLRVHSGAAWPVQAGLSLAAALDPAAAVRAAAAQIDPALKSAPIQTLRPESGTERATVLAGAGFRSPVSARLVWFPRSTDAALAWELFLDVDETRWYCVLVDASTGELLFSHNLYRDQQPRGSVFRAADVPNPDLGPPSLEGFMGWPASAGACPPSIYPAPYQSGSLMNLCWVNGTQTSGNNVVACLDASGANQCDWKASNSQADFEFPFTNSYALSGDATTDQNAAVVNLFYWNNALHDWLYTLGFDEAAGNFQAGNFGRGGFGGDPLLADAQDGQTLNNANFATPPDGSSPRMQIGLFTRNGSFLRRDADFDGQIITHEYVHGLTLRLVGGPGNTNVLPRWQSGAMGEGWSDVYACSFTNNPVFGAYLSATPATGIRSVAYDKSSYTFGRFGTLYRRNVGPLGLIIDLPQVHRDGEIWATALWDLRSALGQPVFEQLLTTALKLTPGRPSMLDARNAILQAAQAMGAGGENQCQVWSVFAARGFGASASLNHIQGGQGHDTALSVYEAFDLPAACGGSVPQAGATLFFDDMESGPNGWTATGLWRQTMRRAAGGATPWWYCREATGNYSTGARTNGSLTSPPITLGSGTKATLEWDQLFLTEGFGHCYSLSSAGCDPYLNYDSGWVQISRDGGSTWDTLTTLAHNSDGPAFDRYKIDVSRYGGSTILVRYYFDTLDANANTSEGWYIDNVAVRRLLTGVPALGVSPASLQFSAPLGGLDPPAQTLAIANLDLGMLNWAAAATSSGWLTVSPASGTGNAILTVTVLSAGLPPGIHNGTVTVSAAGATNSPQVIAVTLTIVGPAAEWRWDETGAGPGVQLVDGTGNGHNGATAGYGSAAFQGVVGYARVFNGTTDRVEADASPALSPASFTFRAWVKLLSYPTAAGWGVVAANYGGNYQGWYVGLSASGRVLFSVASLPSSAPWLLSTTALGLQRWYCITTTYDGSTGQGAIYVNGALDVAAAFPGFTPQSSLPLTFGRASWYDGYYLNFVIDETRLCPFLEGPAQVLADYRSFPVPPPPPGAWRSPITAATTRGGISGGTRAAG